MHSTLNFPSEPTVLVHDIILILYLQIHTDDCATC